MRAMLATGCAVTTALVAALSLWQTVRPTQLAADDFGSRLFFISTLMLAVSVFFHVRQRHPRRGKLPFVGANSCRFGERRHGHVKFYVPLPRTADTLDGVARRCEVTRSPWGKSKLRTYSQGAPEEQLSSIDGDVLGSAELVKFPGLRASDFQHPLDKTATQQVSRFAPIETAIRAIFLPLIEDAVFLDNIGRGVQVSQYQCPSIYKLVVEAASILDMPAPDLCYAIREETPIYAPSACLFIKADPVPNAYTLAIRGKRPFVVLHTSLIDLMDENEIKAVIGHELGHLKCEHGLYITILNILALGIDVVEMLVPLGLRQLISRQLKQWRRSAELSCDRAALLVSQDESVVMSVLMKLTGGAVSLANELSPEEFTAQVKGYDKVASSTWLGMLIRNQDESQLYPLPILRAREVQLFSQSEEYADIKRRLAVSLPSPTIPQ